MDRYKISRLEYMPISFLEEHDTFECVQDEIDYYWSKGKKPDAVDLAQCFAEDWVYRTDTGTQQMFMKKPLSDLIFYAIADKNLITIAIDYLLTEKKSAEDRLNTTTDKADREYLKCLVNAMAMTVNILLEEWEKME